VDPKKILLAIDESPSSQGAVDYVGELTRSCPGFSITIVHVVEDPPEDFFPNDKQRSEFLTRKIKTAEALLDQAKEKLMSYGLSAEQIAFNRPVKTCDSMASCILEEQEEEQFGTLVVGRRGISKTEEFLFGSVSNKILHYAKECTIWVVQ
jgi:nucleotide-binding universal stress UspA family protein